MPQSNPALKTYIIETQSTVTMKCHVHAIDEEDARELVINGQCSYTGKTTSQPKIVSVEEEG